jgi:ketosteroid isomerase-like protein
MKVKCLIPILLCVAAGASAAQEAGDADASARIVALENAWNRAIEVKDLKALDMILDNAMVYVDPQGRLKSKAEMLADLRTVQVDQVVNEAMSVRVHGSTAVLIGIVRSKGLEPNKPYAERARFVDVWMEKQGHWVCISSQLTLISH